jgi:hypothetical protein
VVGCGLRCGGCLCCSFGIHAGAIGACVLWPSLLCNLVTAVTQLVTPVTPSAAAVVTSGFVAPSMPVTRLLGSSTLCLQHSAIQGIQQIVGGVECSDDTAWLPIHSGCSYRWVVYCRLSLVFLCAWLLLLSATC